MSWLQGIAVFVLAGAPAFGVGRSLTIEAPHEVKAGAGFHVTVSAATDAADGEQIGFFQVDASWDGGRTWVPARYLDNLGGNSAQRLDFVSPAGAVQLAVRVRAAFRGGLAGNVDWTGAAIRWHDSWEQWREPPARSVVIRVTAN